jgi:tRNA 2-thiocytidine biosynthesis protein TtcA
MLAALQNVRPSHLLDRGLWKALGVHAAQPDEDEAQGPQRDGIVPGERLARGLLG